MVLPAAIITILAHFQPAFTGPTYHKVLILLVGTLLTRGRHTVAAALRHMGLQHTMAWPSTIMCSTARRGPRSP